MSSVPSLSPAPAPERAELKAVPPRPGRNYWWLAGIAILIIAAAVAWQFRPRAQSQPAITGRTVKAIRGVLQSTLRVTGSVEARDFSNVSAPLVRAPDIGRELVLIKLPDNGSFVKEGEIVAQIDGQAVKDHLDDVKAMVDQTYLELRRVRAQQEQNREVMEQTVRKAKAALEQAREDMRAAAVKTEIEREQMRLTVEEAEARYREVQNEVQLLNERQAAEWRIALLNQDGQVRHRDRHQHDLDRFTVRAPRSGQVILRSFWRNGEQRQLRLGDDVHPGMAFLKIVDLNRMAVEGAISQTDAQKVRLGQQAVVHFDAYPGLRIDGKVAAVGMLAESGRRENYYVRTVPVRIDFQSKDSRVIPDLTAAADVVIAKDEGALLIPRDAVQESNGKSIVLVKRGETVAPREVSLGLANGTQVSVTSGLEEGDVIALPSATP